MNAFIRQLLTTICEALKTRPVVDGVKVVQALSKIQARAIQIIENVKNVTQDNPEKRKEIFLAFQ